MLTVPDRVRQFIVDNFYVEASRVGADTSLITEGIVDSTGMLELIAFIEREYKIRVEDKETIPANLETLSRIDGFIARKRGAAAAS